MAQLVPPNLDGYLRRQFLGGLFAIVTAAFILGAPALQTRAFGQTFGTTLKPGDIVYADSGDAIHGGFIIKVAIGTGAKTVISSGGLLRRPFGVVIEQNGQIVASDSGRLVGIDWKTGKQSLVADNSEGVLGSPYGVALDQSGGLVAANLSAVIRVDLATRQIHPISTGGFFGAPLGVTVAADGQLYVVNIGSVRQILRINPGTGAQSLVTQGRLLKNPQAIAVHGNDIYLTDVATADGNFGVGCIVRVDARTSEQTILSKGGNLVGPVGIAVRADGQLIVGDPYAINPQSPNLGSGGYDGAIINVNPANGNQTVLARGQGSFVNPRGVAIVPTPASGQ